MYIKMCRGFRTKLIMKIFWKYSDRAVETFMSIKYFDNKLKWIQGMCVLAKCVIN